MRPPAVFRGGSLGVALLLLAGCSSGGPDGGVASTDRPSPTFVPASEASTQEADPLIGEPIDDSSLTGRLVFSSEDDVFVADADGTGLRQLTTHPGPEFDPAWAPDGSHIVYRDSRRGINQDDEIYVMRADGTGRRNLTRNPANDWGPAWSPDGTTIVFNSDRDGLPMGGFLVESDGSNLRRIPTDVYVEYPAWAPDGTRIAFMGYESLADYDIHVMNADGTGVTRLTDTPGSDGWPAWSPDGTMIAFASERDDCRYGGDDCLSTGDVGPFHTIYVMDSDGSNLHRVSTKFGQFVTWSPDGQYLLVSGFHLFLIRPDGTGFTRLEIEGLPGGGLFPDWIA